MSIENLLHPELREHLPAIKEIITCAKEVSSDPERLADLIAEDESWLAAYSWYMDYLTCNSVVTCGGTVYGVPFLAPEFCDLLLVGADQSGYEVNKTEGQPYQIPEIILADKMPDHYAVCVELIQYLNLWFNLIWQLDAGEITSIQLAKYEPSDTPRGNWHHDRDSDLTAVVSLAPELHTGGGTDIRLSATAYHRAPPLPKGFALIFNGKLVQHRGCPVESGERNLLVYWLKAPAFVPAVAES